MKLAKNAIYEVDFDKETSSLFRILDMNHDKAAVIKIGTNSLPEVIDLAHINSLVDDNLARILEHDPAEAKILPENDISEKARLSRDANWDVIAPIATDTRHIWGKKGRWKAVLEAAARTGKQPKAVYRILKKYWEGGQIKNALLPDYFKVNAGRTRRQGVRSGIKPLLGGISIGQAEEEKFLCGIKAFYDNKNKPSLRSAYRKTLARFFNSGFEIKGGVTVPILPPPEMLPTLRQFQYWFSQHRSLEKSLRAREGKNFNLKFRPLVGHSTSQSFGPGDLYQIDSTVGDVYLVSSINPNTIVGRPTLYLVTDVFTRCIAGFNLTLEEPSYVQAALAIENACSDKVEFCKQYNIDIAEEEWPCKGIPTNLVADRGELKGIQADQIEAGLGICLTNTPPYRADMKGIVERTFQIGNKSLFHLLPGAVTKSRERGDSDPRLGAKLNIYELTRLVISWILNHNRKRMEHYPAHEAQIAEGIEPIPNVIWKWGLGQNQSLPYKNSSVLRTLLLPQGEAGITPRGIHFKKAYYHSETGAMQGWFLKAREGGGQKIKIAYDPRNTSVIYLRIGETVETCPRDHIRKGIRNSPRRRPRRADKLHKAGADRTDRRREAANQQC